jgi:signal transduction histidine kinase
MLEPLPMTDDKPPVNILILEDDDLDFEILRRRLAEDPDRYQLTRAITIADACALAARGGVDAALVDFKLTAGATGLDFVNAVGGREAAFPIILLTGLDDKRLCADALAVGAYDFLDKSDLDAGTADRSIRFALSSFHYERRLRAAMREAAEQAEINRRILAIVGHEMHSPLRSIIGYCDVIASESGGFPARDAAGKMKSAATHLEDFLRNLTEYVKLDGGGAKLIEERFNLRALVEETADFFRPYAAHKLIRLETRAHDADVLIEADRLRLRQILINLLRNAITHSDEGSILVTAQAGQDSLELSVEDNGVGMPAKMIEAILEDRFAARSEGAGPGGGLGIGLTICRRLLALMHGNLAIESAPGVGTTVRICAPLKLPKTGAA